MPAPAALAFDLFCRVVDNYGDIGVCWRLAADLGTRGHRVRMWADDAAALAWMAPDGASGVEVHPWHAAEAATPANVVIEAFGCDPPDAFVARMAARAAPPRWINLEYLSAEAWVERCHGLPSPQLAGPGRGLVKRFFYPGFTPQTGGLLREPDLAARQAAFDRNRWLAARGIALQPGERLVSLFCYPGAPLPLLWSALAGTRARVLLTPGAAQALAAEHPPPAGLHTEAMPWLTQRDYDHLLWSCDLNLVRGEDSAVRAMWAGAPFVWQLYPQHDGAHGAKLDAFMARFATVAAEAVTAPLGAWWRAWNGLGPCDAHPGWPDLAPWRAACGAWRDALAGQTDLTTQLLGALGDPPHIG
jgi:uncharacterized repeat protein (TIGR03837 family)